MYGANDSTPEKRVGGKEEMSKTGIDAQGGTASPFQPFPSILTAIFLILTAGILVYANSLHGPFLFSDIQSIPTNPVIRDLRNFFANSSGCDYNPRRFVGYLTLALNYHFGGLEVAGYHVFNLGVHLCAALLVYALVLLSFRTPHLRESRLAQRSGLTALLASLLFVTHPVQTMAVTFVVQRLTSLTTLFYLLAMVLYVSARLKAENESGKAGGWKIPALLIGGSVVSAILAMKTKEISFTLPLAVALYELFFFYGEWKRRFLYLVPLLLTLPIVPLSILGSPDAMVAQVRVQTEMSRLDYLFTEFRVIVTYLRLLVFPVNQNLDYDYPLYTSFFAPPVLLSFLLLASFFALAMYLYFRTRPVSPDSQRSFPPPAEPALRLISFGILWFFLALSVESSLIPIVDVIFEYRLYLPSVGAIIAAVTAFALLLDRVRNQNLVNALMVGAVAVVLIFGIATWKRNIVWQSQLNMWRDVAAKSPNKARPQVNLGAALGEQGRMAEAVAALSTAVRLEPDNPDPYVNLGAALASLGRLDEAISALSRAVALEPANADAGNNLGLALILAGRQEEAIPVLVEAVRLDPDFERAWYNLGHGYLLAGRNNEAIAALKRALEIYPDYGNALVLLAEALNRQKQYQETMNLLSARLQAFANWPDVRRALGMAAHCLGDNSTASRELAALQQLDYQQARQLSDIMAHPCNP